MKLAVLGSGVGTKLQMPLDASTRATSRPSAATSQARVVGAIVPREARAPVRLVEGDARR